MSEEQKKLQDDLIMDIQFVMVKTLRFLTNNDEITKNNKHSEFLEDESRREKYRLLVEWHLTEWKKDTPQWPAGWGWTWPGTWDEWKETTPVSLTQALFKNNETVTA